MHSADQQVEKTEPKHILVVDDFPRRIDFISRFLWYAGYRVTQAPNAEDALAKLAAHPDIDLVLTDFKMPDHSGTKLAEMIDNPDLPVIVYCKIDQLRAIFGHESVAHVLTLPIRPLVLLHEVRNLLENRALLQELRSQPA
jgi:CheY-like chemotaxis protein